MRTTTRNTIIGAQACLLAVLIGFNLAALLHIKELNADAVAERDRGSALLDRLSQAEQQLEAEQAERAALQAEVDHLKQRIADAARRERAVRERARASRSRRSTASVHTVDIPAVLTRIRECESHGNYRAENGVSTASGAYQFVDGTWRSVTGLQPPASAYSRAVQDRAAVKLWAGGKGAHHWAASRHCWR